MRQQVIAVLVLSGFILLPIQVKGQDKYSSDKTWPSLGSDEKNIHDGRPRFVIDHEKLEIARNVSNPLSVTRCLPSSQPCILRMRVDDFFSEWKGSTKGSVLRPDVMMHHYPLALFDGHYRGTGTYVFYLPKQKVFYLWGDCWMGHVDLIAGPFSGDPRLVLKKLARAPDSVAVLGMLLVAFQAQRHSDEGWPGIPSSGIEISKLGRAQKGFNPLSLDRCRASSEKCVMNMEDFTVKRRNQLVHRKMGSAPGRHSALLSWSTSIRFLFTQTEHILCGRL